MSAVPKPACDGVRVSRVIVIETSSSMKAMRHPAGWMGSGSVVPSGAVMAATASTVAM